MSEILIFNGELLAKDDLDIHPENRGMMYGDGCFDTLIAYKGKFLHLDDHHSRLMHGLEYLGINPVLSKDEFRAQILELLTAKSLTNSNAIIRTQCWREGERGYYSDSRKGNYMITASTLSEDREPISLITADTRSIPGKALSRSFKLSNGINYFKAAQEAADKGADDALMLTTGDIISEATSSNLFWMTGKIVYTPSDKCDLLPGITRQILINIIRESRYLNLQIEKFPKRFILSADSAFVTNSIKEIIPVSKLDQTIFDTENEVLMGLIEEFEAYKLQYLS